MLLPKFWYLFNLDAKCNFGNTTLNLAKMKLSELKEGEVGIIIKVKGHGNFRKRIIEMGFVRGKEIKVVRYAPLKDPIEYQIMGYEVSLRKSEAELIEVERKNGYIKPEPEQTEVSLLEAQEGFRERIKEKTHTINVALVGNPNCGKTTLFNIITGSAEHVGNYGGVTVDAKKGKTKRFGYTFEITDLPGTYSLTTYSPEEVYVRHYLLYEFPDVIINVVDASNLERNLYLTTQLIDMNIPIVIALNMYDELQRSGDKLDYEALGELMGCPIVPTIASTNFGIDQLLQKVIDVYEDLDSVIRPVKINYGFEIENAIEELIKVIDVPENKYFTNIITPRFIAVKLLEKDKDMYDSVKMFSNGGEIIDLAHKYIAKIEKQMKEDTEILIADARYGFISGALAETYQKGNVDRYQTTKFIDSIVTNKYLGFLIFFAFLWLMFESTFKLAQYPVGWLDFLVSWTGDLVSKLVPPGMLQDLLVNGIIGGVGSVLVFLPNILILFFFIAIMEDTGYMARVAFIMDKLMHKIGLHGKSFIPLLMGFGCNVPAIMATRTIENRTDRLLTMLINPFMSCSARLPVYILILGTFFPKYAGIGLLAIYSVGILVAIISAIIFKKTLFKKHQSPFVMELPPYRLPTLRVLGKDIWNKAKQYLQKMGGVILVASILIWALENFPRPKVLVDAYLTQKQKIEQRYDSLMKAQPKQIAALQVQKDSVLDALKLEFETNLQEQSYVARLGRFFEPVMRPLGFDWKMTVGAIAGISAKEIVVSTLGVLYNAENNKSLSEKLRQARYTQGKRKGHLIFTPAVALAFIVFILLYSPCVATMAAIAGESGSWKWAIFQLVYSLTVAWILSFLVLHIAELII